MEAKQLSIGDFVKSDLGTIYKVKGVRTLDGGEVLVSTGAADMWYEQSFINPIPLTPEILQKNGFDMRVTLGEWCPELIDESKSFGFINCYCEEPLQIRIAGNSVHVQYVHELQRALRC